MLTHYMNEMNINIVLVQLMYRIRKYYTHKSYCLMRPYLENGKS